jgi:hypothetical protein
MSADSVRGLYVRAVAFWPPPDGPIAIVNGEDEDGQHWTTITDGLWLAANAVADMLLDPIPDERRVRGAWEGWWTDGPEDLKAEMAELSTSSQAPGPAD